MIPIRKSFVFVGILFLCIQFCCGQEKPRFPPVFQVEVQGIFKNSLKEMVGTIYYDSMNNRAVFHLTDQGVTTQYIYRFDDKELLLISGSDCTVYRTRTMTHLDSKFFQFFVKGNGENILAKPEDMLYFTNSTFHGDGPDFPSYIYKGKSSFLGVNCEVTHIFTKPQMKVPDCGSNICQPTLVTMSIACPNAESTDVQTYDFFRFKSNIVDTNVFSPPSGVFCNVKNKNKFPGLPDYFSFTYDLIDNRKGTVGTSYVPTVHKKVWYDSNNKILRMDEFDAEWVRISSKVFDLDKGAAYTLKTSLPSCQTISINTKDVPVDEMTKLPIVFFQEEDTLSNALFVGTRRIQGLDYEVWSLTNNEQTPTKVVQEFYFTKSVPRSGASEILKLSRAEIYTYQPNKGDRKYEQPALTHLPVNNFIDRLRWEAFDVSQCFTKEQKREFKLKVDGPPTVKDSKIFQDVLYKLYTNLIETTKISAVRLSNLECIHDGVKIVEFTGLILDTPKVLSTDSRNVELSMNETFRMIDYLASNQKLSLKMSKDGEIVEYKITAIEDIKHEEEDKNLYSGGVVAAFVFGCTPLAIFAGAFCSIKMRKKRLENDSIDGQNFTGENNPNIGQNFTWRIYSIDGQSFNGENHSIGSHSSSGSQSSIDEDDSIGDHGSIGEKDSFADSVQLKAIKS